MNIRDLLTVNSFDELVSLLTSMDCEVYYSNKVDSKAVYGHYVILGVLAMPHLQYDYIPSEGTSALGALKNAVEKAQDMLELL